MKKILLVEDDKSLREIYAVRLIEEGYDIVSAGDGEQALAMAIKERPILIISDVMMPKISGFDMLDILRSTTETKDIKVIIMTALSSEDQRSRGEQLGADKYLVKSQVGIEDVVRAVHDVLRDASETTTPAPAPAAPAQASTPSPQPMAPSIPQPRPATTAVPPRPTAPPANVALPQPNNLSAAPAPQPVPTAPAPQATTQAVPAPADFTSPAPMSPPPAPAPVPRPEAPRQDIPVPAGSTARIIEPLTPQDDANEVDRLSAQLSKELQEVEATTPQPSVQAPVPSITLPTPPPAPTPFDSNNNQQTPPPVAPPSL